MDGTPDVDRRTVLKGAASLGALGAAGLGGSALVGSAAASNFTVGADNVELENDDGMVREVTIDPELNVSWRDFDDAVGAVSIFVEAYVEGNDDGPNGGWYPLHRSEPVLEPGHGSNFATSGPGTTGELDIGPFSGLTTNRADLDDWSNATSEDGNLSVADREHGAPDLSSASEGYTQGANVSSNTIPGTPGEGAFVNGEYGAAADADVFDVTGDGTSGSTTVHLRYTVQLLELGVGHFEYLSGETLVPEGNQNAWSEDPVTVGETRQALEDMYDATAGEWDVAQNAGLLSDVMPKDVTIAGWNKGAKEIVFDESAPVYLVNQKLPVMTGPDAEYPRLDNPTSRHAAAARAYADEQGHPAIMSNRASFEVTVNNTGSSSSGDGSSGGEANGVSNSGAT